MDLISRQAAIDAINRLDIPEDMCVFEILSHIALAIGTLPSAQPQPQWIPVSERMPEDSYETDLIVTTGSGMVKLACYTKEYGFTSITSYHQFSEVVAWMPLPEPYRGE